MNHIRREIITNNMLPTNRLLLDAFSSYHALTKRVFTFPIPQKGRILEIMKRTTVIAAPILYPVFGIVQVLSRAYINFGRRNFKELVDNSYHSFNRSIGHGNRNVSPHQLVVLFNIKINNDPLYSEAIHCLEENQRIDLYMGALNTYREFIEANVDRSTFYAGTNAQVEWIGYVRMTDQSHKIFANRAYGIIGEGHGVGASQAINRSLEDLNTAFNHKAQQMNPRYESRNIFN